MKLLKKWFKKLQSNMGYTLIEVSAVVAITATLGAVAVPIVLDKANEAKKAAANDTTKVIGGAITAFYKDTGNFPAASATLTQVTYYMALRSGAEQNLTLVALHDPIIATDKWLPATTVDVLDNHLTQDNPGGTPNTAAPNTAYVNTHKFSNWKGPYSEPFVNTDPWGHNYLVYLKAMHTATTGSTKEYGWILSAGPNGIIQTDVLNSTLQGDDIGYALFSAEVEHSKVIE